MNHPSRTSSRRLVGPLKQLLDGKPTSTAGALASRYAIRGKGRHSAPINFPLLGRNIRVALLRGVTDDEVARAIEEFWSGRDHKSCRMFCGVINRMGAQRTGLGG